MISTKGRYALRILIDLAEHGTEEPVLLWSIAERQGISKKYLEIIVRELVNADFVTGARGKGGGYRLSRRPEEYTVGEILERMEGPFASVACLTERAAPCPRASACPTLPLWEEYDKLTHDFFYGKRLSDLLG